MSDGSADGAPNGATGGPGLPGRVSAEGQERDQRIDGLAGDMPSRSVNATPRNDELGTAADHDRPGTTFRAPGGRLARRHHHRPQRDRLLELSQRGENESPCG